MPPPEYKDIGKNAEDVMHKGEYFGLINLLCKTKTEHTEVKVEGQSDQETGKVKGLLESRHFCKDLNVKFSEGWNTDNILNTEVSCENNFLEGLKLSSIFTLKPESGRATALLKTGFANDCFAVYAEGDIKDDAKIVSLTATIEQNGWVAGFQGAADPETKKFTTGSLALGFNAGDWEWFSRVLDGKKFNSTFYKKINPKLETAIGVNWNKEDESTLLIGACRYELDQDASLSVNLNSKSQIGLGYQQRIRDEVTLSFSALIDAKNAKNGGHKVGLGLELEL